MTVRATCLSRDELVRAAVAGLKESAQRAQRYAADGHASEWLQGYELGLSDAYTNAARSIEIALGEVR